MSETIVDVAARHARERGDRLAYAMLADGTDIAAQITFAELDARARSVATGLRTRVRDGDRAVLVYETGLDFVSAFLGCLYARVIAVPVPAPEASRMQSSLARLDAVLRDSGAALVLVNPRTQELLVGASAIETRVADGALALVDTTALYEAASGPLASPERSELAYLQYTSGSTSTPKGVMIDHANVVDHCFGMQRGLGYDQSSVSVCWMPHFHDYGLIEGILVPLFNGTPSYLMSPFAFLKRPGSWLGAIAKYRGTHTQAFNFAYRYCCRRITARTKAGLDLSSLRSAGNGGEPIHPDTSQEFAVAFAECGLAPHAPAPVFGLAEATLLVTAVPPGESPIVLACDAGALTQGRVAPPAGDAMTQRIVACGPPLPDTDIRIVDPDSLAVLPPDAIGEVWVSAPGVARGYWNRAEESNDMLQARIPGDTSGRRYLRTGDLGTIHNGQLYITARRKDLIIIHGMNHHPQDIEWTVQQVSPLLRADHGAAFGMIADGEERLCIVQEIERGTYDEPTLHTLAESVAEAVTRDHGVALHGLALINRGSITKTTSGKIQRSAAQHAFARAELDAVFTWRARSAS